MYRANPSKITRAHMFELVDTPGEWQIQICEIPLLNPQVLDVKNQVCDPTL